MDRSRATVRVFGRCLLLALLSGTGQAGAAELRPLAECEAMVQRAPRSLDGYVCLLLHRGRHSSEVLRFLDARFRLDPENPRPRLYRAIVRSLGGGEIDDREWALSSEGFAREHDVTGEVYAITSHVAWRCFGRLECDEPVRALLWRAGELARASGKPELERMVEVWRMKRGFAIDDLVEAEAAQARLLALGAAESTWIRSESLQARAHLAAVVRDHATQRSLYGELVATLDPGDPQRAVAFGGMAAGAVHLALAGLESRESAERLIREALAAQEHVGIPVKYVESGYLPARVHLALLLGPTPEAFSLLRSALAGHRAFPRWSTPRLTLSEFLATADHPHLEEALEVAEGAVDLAFGVGGDYERVRSLVLRSRIRFRVGQYSSARADGLAALDRAERLREQQRELPVRLRYAESLSFAYRSLAGALLQFRPDPDDSAVDDAFQVMERLRARGLMETLLADDRSGPLRGESPVSAPPDLRKVRADLGPQEALLSFEVWRPEPTVDAPYREGRSWATVVTSRGAHAFPIPNADVLEPQIRAWTGLLERRDGSDRAPGARLHAELLGPAIAVLPPGIRRLVVIPDGPLHRLPFDALSAGPGTAYLAERFEVSVEPSAALWLRFRAAQRLPPGRLLVLADPAELEARAAVPRAGTSVFGALAHAHEEAEVALAAFPAGSELRTGAPASESFLKSSTLQGISLLHLATHAVADERDPERAAVVLAPGSPSEDGRLEPREIARLPLAGKTVVLAGCETSVGPVFRGEGVMSLARAFFSAGATAVVGTLNRARDDEAGAFFSAMYRGLGRGETVGEAVAGAKREGIRRGAPPAAWADVVLLGDAQARPRQPEGPGAIPVVLMGALVAFAGLGVGRWWWRRHEGEGKPAARASMRRRGNVASLPLARPRAPGGEEATPQPFPGRSPG